jgi:hypothetical protein
MKKRVNTPDGSVFSDWSKGLIDMISPYVDNFEIYWIPKSVTSNRL